MEKNSVDFDLTDSFFNLFHKDGKKVGLVCFSLIQVFVLDIKSNRSSVLVG